MSKVPTPTVLQLIKNPVYLLAFGFGTGLSPIAPGTFGTLITIPVFLLLAQTNLLLYLCTTFFLLLAGIWICGQAARQLGVHDHGGIVWDEIVGFLITMIAVPATLTNIVIGFFLFRFFDILKPWPVSWADRNVHGGFGIMLDDIFAGLMAWMVFQALLFWVL